MGFDFVNTKLVSTSSGSTLVGATLSSPTITGPTITGTITTDNSASYSGIIATGSFKLYIKSGLIISSSLQ